MYPVAMYPHCGQRGLGLGLDQCGLPRRATGVSTGSAEGTTTWSGTDGPEIAPSLLLALSVGWPWRQVDDLGRSAAASGLIGGGGAAISLGALRGSAPHGWENTMLRMPSRVTWTVCAGLPQPCSGSRFRPSSTRRVPSPRRRRSPGETRAGLRGLVRSARSTFALRFAWSPLS
jgi:hypothetical protein